ncbi:hypothetical protein DL89DRAFT_146266 [Linderina pennispora]|uniref:Uncharacterized protein n=1 Tax=Linderina pennispora TaxID=61395 RepID=A0A1Y1VUJ9_9FUNG|nr:uncharacterized protein DL89DRAFT_146266 [Linderina pennispora]ORX64961.1 hypothetical protein DL89DRAFT_146266 [Linderina pennispora]
MTEALGLSRVWKIGCMQATQSSGYGRSRKEGAANKAWLLGAFFSFTSSSFAAHSHHPSPLITSCIRAFQPQRHSERSNTTMGFVEELKTGNFSLYGQWQVLSRRPERSMEGGVRTKHRELEHSYTNAIISPV